MTTSTDIKKALALMHRDRGDYFVTECRDGPTGRGTRILDGVAIKKSWVNPCITGYEIKISRSDFLGDNKFYTYLPLVNILHIVCPSGMIKRDELPVEVGLIWYDPDTGKLRTKKKPPRREIEISTDMLMYIIFSKLDPDRIPFYSSQKEYIKDYLANKIDNQDLVYEFRGKIFSEISRLAAEVKRLKYRDYSEPYEKLIQTMRQNGMSTWEKNPDKWIEQQLKKEHDPKIEIVEVRLRAALEEIEEMKGATK